jgi:hypothetical protein
MINNKIICIEVKENKWKKLNTNVKDLNEIEVKGNKKIEIKKSEVD